MSEPNGCTIPMIFSLIALVLAPLFGAVLNESGLDLTSSGPCTIQAERADVAVRVGPGPNRAIRAYLPTNRAFPVIGKATAGDGSLWWKVDIAGFEQAWVAQSDVAAVGGCALVADVDAPPVILAPPTVAPISPASPPPIEDVPPPPPIEDVPSPPPPPSEGTGQQECVCPPMGWDTCVYGDAYPGPGEMCQDLICYDTCGNECDRLVGADCWGDGDG